MAKKVFFLLFFSAFFLRFAPNIAANKVSSTESLSTLTDECNAPAPDSFRVTGTTGSIISLAWHPVSFGAIHTLTVFEKDISGNWNLLYAYYNVSGASFNVSNMIYGKEYQFVICTNCNNGESSSLKSSIDYINLIIDLTLLGRTPINPSTLEGCPLVNYATNNWVGFSISLPYSTASYTTKFFEVDEGLSTQGILVPTIKRDDSFWLVASDDDVIYPKKPAPLVWEIQGTYSFKIYHIKGFQIPHLVGTLRVVDFDSDSNTIKICKHPSFNWDQNYTFTMLTATSAVMHLPSITESRGEDDRFENADLINEVKVQSPFTDLLGISFPELTLGQGEAFIRILNTSGQILISTHIEIASGKVILPVESLSNGLYIFQIEINGKQQILKIVKAE